MTQIRVERAHRTRLRLLYGAGDPPHISRGAVGQQVAKQRARDPRFMKSGRFSATMLRLPSSPCRALDPGKDELSERWASSKTSRGHSADEIVS